MDNHIDQTLNERGLRYGLFIDNSEISQSLKDIIHQGFGERWYTLVSDQREALDMIAHKISRIVNGDPHYADSWVDIAGYAKLVADRLNGDAR